MRIAQFLNVWLREDHTGPDVPRQLSLGRWRFVAPFSAPAAAMPAAGFSRSDAGRGGFSSDGEVSSISAEYRCPLAHAGGSPAGNDSSEASSTTSKLDSVDSIRLSGFCTLCLPRCGDVQRAHIRRLPPPRGSKLRTSGERRHPLEVTGSGSHPPLV